MSEYNHKSSQSDDYKEIDLIELARKVWDERKLIIRFCIIAIFIGLIIIFSIPREYTTSVTLAPETQDKGGKGNMNALAAMAGINLGTSSGQDALFPELYPNIVSSTPFLLELLPVNLQDVKGENNTDVYNYINDELRSPWWNTVIKAPLKLLGWGMSLFRENTDEVTGNLDPFRLNKEESRILQTLNGRISVSIDKKTGITSLSVTMQDPLISATLTDTVMSKLQDYITEYRTNKARNDLDYITRWYEEAKQEYFDAQKKYASYRDRNQDVVKESFRAEGIRLEQNMNIAYNLYNQVAQQLQMAHAKVQEITPVYTVIQPATVPLNPSKPNKPMILIGFVFFAGVLSVAWILFIRDFLRNWKSKSK